MKLYTGILLVVIVLPVQSFAADNPFFRTGNQAQMLIADAATEKPLKISAGQAAQKARQTTGGKVLSVTSAKGKPVYRVKILSKTGVVKIVKVDGTTGKVYE